MSSWVEVGLTPAPAMPASLGVVAGTTLQFVDSNIVVFIG